MFRHNNPDIDYAALAARVRAVCGRRRAIPYETPLSSDEPSEPDVADALQDALPCNARGWKARLRWIRRVPVFGPLLVALKRSFDAATAPRLPWQARLRHVPLLGPTLFWINGLLRAPGFRMQATEELAALRELVQARIEPRLVQLSQHMEQLSQRTELLSLHMERLSLRADRDQIENKGRNDKLAGNIDSIQDKLAEHIASLQDRLGSLTQAVRRMEKMPAPGTTATSAMPASISAPAGAEPQFYLDFENRFRGTDESVRERLQDYAPLIGQGVAGGNIRLLDLGCGRGEWLDLVRSWGHAPEGVDCNAAMVDGCTERGLKVHLGDALAFLRAQPEASFDAVSAFHLIEHLPLQVLISLFDEALRVLRPGGFVLFETPNPENLQVGACNFYLDPTHLNPIPPAVAEFIAQQRGFARAEIRRLNAYPPSYLVAEDNELARRFNQLIYGPQDYALVAWKHER